MQRVKRTTAVDVLPADPVGGTPGYFPLPNPGGGVPAAVPGYEWYNNVQEELCAVIAAAGIALDGANRAQVLAALRSAGVFTTPAQFDNSTKVATTAFVKTSGMQFAGVVGVSTTPFNVSAAACAGQFLYASGGAGVINLPAASTFPNGVGLTIQTTVPVTINRADADLVYLSAGGQTAITLNAGDSLTLYSGGAGIWYSPGNSVQLKYAGVFGSSLAASGYQKLPSGLIAQWGVTSVAASNADTNVTLPIAYTTSHFVAYGSFNGVATTSQIGARALSLTQIRLNQSYTGGAQQVAWLSIGY